MPKLFRLHPTLICLAIASLSATGARAQAPPAAGDPLPGLRPAERTRFDAGKAQFIAEEGADEGVGPVFNATSCVTCHAGPAPGGSSQVFATRIGLRTRAGFDPLLSLGGPTVQVEGIGEVPGVTFVGEVVPPRANVVAKRRSNPIFGLGLVDAVPDRTFLELAAMQTSQAPAIAGRPNLVRDLRTGRTTVGRFGWKAQVGSLYDFAADAYKDEMGVTTAGFTRPGAVDVNGSPLVFPFFRSADGRSVSEENPPQGKAALLQFDPIPGPDEPDDEDVIQLADFMTLLAPPTARQATPVTLRGQAIFARIGCASCHTPTLVTGPNAVAALNQRTFHPYSDFLLHNMGTLGDGIESADAKGADMRTTPLWGLSGLPFYLHDGRAKTIEQAIRLHDGQGKAAAKRFNALTDASRVALLEFLKSL